MNDREHPTLLSLNRFEAKKGAILAIDSFAALRKKVSDNPQLRNIRLVVAGKKLLMIASLISFPSVDQAVTTLDLRTI